MIHKIIFNALALSPVPFFFFIELLFQNVPKEMTLCMLLFIVNVWVFPLFSPKNVFKVYSENLRDVFKNNNKNQTDDDTLMCAKPVIFWFFETKCSWLKSLLACFIIS